MEQRLANVSAQWLRLIASARQRWTRLSEDDLLAVKGNTERLISLLQERYGLARDQALRELVAWRQSLVVQAGRAA